MARFAVALLLPGIVVGQDLFLSSRVAAQPSKRINLTMTQNADLVANQTILTDAVESSFIDPFSAAVAFKLVMAMVHGQASVQVHGATAQAFFHGASEYTRDQFVDALTDTVDEKLAEMAGIDEHTYKSLKTQFFLAKAFRDVMSGAWGQLYQDCIDRADEVTNDHIVHGLSEYLDHLTDATATQQIQRVQTCLYSMSQLMCNYDSDPYNKNHNLCGGYVQVCTLSGCCHVGGENPRDEMANRTLYEACCF